MLPLMSGTLMIAGIAMLVAVPLGLMTAVYLAEYASYPVRNIAKPIIELAVDQRGDSLSFLVCHGLKHPGWFRPITCGPRTGACVIGHATPNHSHLRQTKGNRCCTQGSSSGRSRLSMASRALKMRDLTVPIGQSIALAISS
jgi:hypothetical protein